MEGALKSKGLEARLQPVIPEKAIEIPNSWMPDLAYVIFSNEHKALTIARAIQRQANEIPLLFGRSLLRESFLTALGSLDGEFWFVDIIRRNAAHTESQRRFIQVMATHGIMIPTANHAFGWDAMKFGAAALKAARGNPSSAIAYLESGVILTGASGNCSFSQQNHNGRLGFGPTTLTRWHQGQLQDA
jgi:ABC-type branched-subunit amino acid transport system substrate-binding protein